MPLSKLTAASLADGGYIVNMATVSLFIKPLLATSFHCRTQNAFMLNAGIT